MTAILKKNASKWIVEAKTAFDTLKKAMPSTLVLALPDFSQPFVVECDASEVGLGVVLQQNDRPIAYFSRVLPL